MKMQESLSQRLPNILGGRPGAYGTNTGGKRERRSGEGRANLARRHTMDMLPFIARHWGPRTSAAHS